MNPGLRKEKIRRDLEETRARTLELLASVPDRFLKTRVHDFYSPVGWHFGHVGMTEEHWTVHRALGLPCLDDRLSFLFANLPENPKDRRIHLPEREEILAYLFRTRERTLDALDQADLQSPQPLLRDGYAWEFAIQHECQHQETIAELLHLIHMHCPLRALPEPLPWKGRAGERLIGIPGGAFVMGSDDRHAYDNEKEPHRVQAPDFELEESPVTCFRWSLFMADGGYSLRDLWSDAGWDWRVAERADRPMYWLNPSLGGHFTYSLEGVRALHPDEPVYGVSWFEAEAFCRWAGMRLPSEVEWEYAARRDPETEQSRRFPWGDEPPAESFACFGLRGPGPAPVGGRPAGASQDGILDLAGQVWEWTSSAFLPYPGFRAFPYDGYSLEHMDGNHRVCRGGSWATSARILRASFRNWYVPSYRQGFLGVRCAR